MSEHGEGLRRAAEVMRQVHQRCVWTQAMTHEGLVPYLVEESAELVDAVETGDRAGLREELGDLLWQVLFHAEIASHDPDQPFTVDEVADDLAEKMTRRHPHVFAGVDAPTPERVLEVWNAAKAAEKRERRSVLDGVSHAMPALALAQKLVGKADAVDARVPPAEAASNEAELGEALLQLVVAARRGGIDAERALRMRLRALEDDIRDRE